MRDQKIIAVVGATGMQGGGLVRALVNDRLGPFKALALTRSTTSDKAKALTTLGIQVVPADLDDLDSLKRAFIGAHGAFCVTNYWEHLSPQKELAQAKNLATAAKHAALRHVMWSTLEDTRRWVPLTDDRMPTLMQQYKVPHFDAKGEADKYFTELGVPTTFLLTSFYWDNFIYFGMGPKKNQDGLLAITFPMGDKKLPGIAAEDIGPCALAIFKRGDDDVGKTIGIAGEHLTGVQIAASLSKALGQEVRYQDVAPEVYRSFGFPGADDVGNMFQFKRDFNEVFCGPRDPAVARSLYPSLHTFDQWLKENKDRIPLT
jgi:uncharacterized protein YbjT (DUF2867 family)